MTKNQKRAVNVFLLGFVFIAVAIAIAVIYKEDEAFLPYIKGLLYAGAAMVCTVTIYSVLFPIKPHHKS